MRLRIPALLILIAHLAAACNLPFTAPPTDEAASPAPVITSAAPGPTALPGGSGPCLAEAVEVAVFTRPSMNAEPFGNLTPEMPVTITGRSSDGWLGFDPGVAQAANIGVFRLRWIPPGASLNLTGDCASVPVEPWVPEAGVCYQMSMEPVEVFNDPDRAAAVTGVLNVGDFASVDAQTPSGWLLVNGIRANTPDVFGYIPAAAANFSGPCDSIPELVP